MVLLMTAELWILGELQLRELTPLRKSELVCVTAVKKIESCGEVMFAKFCNLHEFLWFDCLLLKICPSSTLLTTQTPPVLPLSPSLNLTHRLLFHALPRHVQRGSAFAHL